MQESTPTAGQSHTLTCTVTPQRELTGTPTVQWIYPIATGRNFTVSSTPPYTFTINALHEAQDGQYTCQATLGSVTGTGSATFHVEGDWHLHLDFGKNNSRNLTMFTEEHQS